MTRKKDSSMGTFAGLGKAMDETVKVAADAATGRLGKTEMRDWYNDRRTEGQEFFIMVRDRASGVTEPLRSAAGLGRDIIEGAIAPSPRPRRRRPSHGRRAGHKRRK